MNEVDFLPTDVVVEHIVLRPLTAVHMVQADSEISIDIEIINTGQNILSWNHQHPVTLSYRWFDMTTGALFPLEGNRAFFDGFLHPDRAQTLNLTIKTPAFHGMTTLRMSCVSEGRFWFYEMFPTGWTDLSVNIVDPIAWPVELRGSFTSRALRGALVANTLQQRLNANPVQCMVPLSTNEPSLNLVVPSHEKEIFITPSYSNSDSAEVILPRSLVEIEHTRLLTQITDPKISLPVEEPVPIEANANSHRQGAFTGIEVEGGGVLVRVGPNSGEAQIAAVIRALKACV